MRCKLGVVIAALFLGAVTVGGQGTIFTVVGKYTRGSQISTQTSFGLLSAVAVAATGEVFMSDIENHIVVMLRPDGTYDVIAGSRSEGLTAEGGNSLKDGLSLPLGIALAPGVQPPRAGTGGAIVSGTIYLAEAGNNRVIKLKDGVVTTVAGGAEPGLANPFTGEIDLGDGKPATQANLEFPIHIAFDSKGNLYIADSGHHRIRKVDSAGVISTVAGTGDAGFSGDLNLAIGASLDSPWGVAVDAAGNIYISDSGNQRIRRVNANGFISTIAGDGNADYSGDGSLATAASLYAPTGIALDAAGNLYVADSFNHRIRKVSPAGIISTVAGNGLPDFSGDGGPATRASLLFPADVAVDQAGNIYVADEGNSRVRKVSAAGTIGTIAGAGEGLLIENASLATFTPTAVALDASGNLYFADHLKGLVFKVTPNGILTTFGSEIFQPGFIKEETLAGLPAGGGTPLKSADLNLRSIATDRAGNVYISASGYGFERTAVGPQGGVYGGIWKVSSSAFTTVITKVWDCFESFRDSQPLPDSPVCPFPGSIAVDGAGTVYFAGFKSWQASTGGYVHGLEAVIAKVLAPRQISILSSNTAADSIAVDALGNLYYALFRVYRIGLDGSKTLVAGGGAESKFCGDGGPATNACLDHPGGLALDGAGNLYIADTYNNRVRKVDSRGVITTIAGNGSMGFSGDGGPATSAQLNHPTDLALDTSGNLYLTDSGNGLIRKVTFGPQTGTPKIAASPTSLTFAALKGISPDFPQNLGITNAGTGSLSWTASVATSSGGNWLKVSDNAGTAPSLLSVSADSASLANGTYKGIITINGTGATNSPQTVPAELTVFELAAPPTGLATPSVTPPAITNGASFRSGVTPGSILTIFGTALTKGVDGVVLGGELPLPTQLKGTSVTIGGIPAPLFAIANVGGQEQINLQVPWEVGSQAIADVVVNNNGVKGQAVPMAILLFQPGVFTLDGLTGVILHADNRLVSGGLPAKKGEVVIIYATGLGPVSPEGRTGQAAPSSPLSLTTVRPVVTIGNAVAEVQFSGLAPGFVGLYQLNITIPGSAKSGVQSLIISMEGVKSRPVTIAIE